MKMKFKTCKTIKDSIPSNPGADFLGERLASYLANEEGCFDFYIQPNEDSQKNNIEDAMIEWDSQKSPFLKVGQMRIKKQTGFRSKDRMEACENMSFNPWRAPEVNRPLGGVNRIRLKVYLDQFKLRQEYNRKK